MRTAKRCPKCGKFAKSDGVVDEKFHFYKCSCGHRFMRHPGIEHIAPKEWD